MALRQGAFQGLCSCVFYLPLAFMGFAPSWFAATLSLDLLYQFLIHTISKTWTLAILAIPF